MPWDKELQDFADQVSKEVGTWPKWKREIRISFWHCSNCKQSSPPDAPGNCCSNPSLS